LTFMLAAVYELSAPAGAGPRFAVAGMSAAANLVFAVPAAALVIGWTAARGAWRRLPDLAVPGAAVALVITIIPLSRAEGASFYYGADNLFYSLDSLFGLPGFNGLSGAMIVAAPVILLAALWYGRRDETLRFFAWSLTLCVLAVAVMRIAACLPARPDWRYIVALWSSPA